MLKHIKESLRGWLIAQLLKDFEVDQQKLSPGEFSSAMNDVYTSEHIRKYFNILIANMIRRSLYVSGDMVKHSWFLGAIAVLRKVQTDAQGWKRGLKQGEQDVIDEEKEDESF